MPDVFAIHARGLKAVQNYFGDACPTFSWNGKKYKIFPGSAVRSKGFGGGGGFKLEADLKFVVLASDLPSPGPQLKQQITFLGDVYRIDKLDKGANGTQIKFECNDVNQAA